MSAHRDFSHSPVPGKGPLKSATGITAEYVEAVNLMNESTMNGACELLLNDSLVSQGDFTTESSKLLELYYKCDAAFQTIQKQQPAALPSTGSSSSSATPIGTPASKRSSMGRHPLMPGAPSLSMPKRGSMSKLASKAKNSSANSKVMSSSGLMRTAIGGNGAGGRRSGPGAVSHEMMASPSSAGDGVSSSHHKSKRQKVSNSTAPPPSAVNFLAKLNGEKSSAPPKSTPSPALGRKSPPPAKTPAVGKRRNPDRSKRGSSSS